MEEIPKKIADPKMRSQIEKVAPFYDYLSTGGYAGIQKLNTARRFLEEASEGDSLFVTCETYSCLSDPFQVPAGATIGDEGLKIKDHENMAVIVTMHASMGTNINGMRKMLYPAKTARYPRLHAWFTKTEKVPHPEAISILISAGESVYSWKTMDFDFPEKPGNKIAICERCITSFIQKDDETLRLACQDGLHHS